MHDVNLRLAGMEALPQIVHLKKQIHDLHVQGRPDLFQPQVHEAALTDFFDSERMRLLLAEKDGTAVGYVLMQTVCREANPYMKERRYLHVEEFCVAQAYRHGGIGRLLMNAVRQYAAEAGCPRIELDVWAFNEDAKQFYEAVGMKPFRVYMEMNADE